MESLASAAPTLLTYLGAALLLGRRGLGAAGALDQAQARWGWSRPRSPPWPSSARRSSPGSPRGSSPWTPTSGSPWPTRRRSAAVPADRSGRASLDDLAITGRLRDVLTGVDGVEPDAVVIRSGRVLVLNRMPVSRAGQTLGSVTTLRDRTQLAELERETRRLPGHDRPAPGAGARVRQPAAHHLRADPDRRLRRGRHLRPHPGGQPRGASTSPSPSAYGTRSVAALLVAKSAQAAERRVDLRVGPGTALEPLEPQSSFDVATVLGNLIQNGVDAVTSAASDGTAGRVGWVEVDVRQTGDVVEIVVRDSGPGVASTIASEVFEHGFTTKAARDGERGIGLALIRRICRTRGGDVEVRDSADGSGVRGLDDDHSGRSETSGSGRHLGDPSERRSRRSTAMITVLVVDDDFRVARIHSAFVDRIEGFRTDRRGQHRPGGHPVGRRAGPGPDPARSLPARHLRARRAEPDAGGRCRGRRRS